jgi:hypothetical protein
VAENDEVRTVILLFLHSSKNKNGISIVPIKKNIMIKPFLFAAVVLAGLATYLIINKGYADPYKYLKID